MIFAKGQIETPRERDENCGKTNKSRAGKGGKCAKGRSSFDPLKTQFANMRTTVKQNSKFIEFETPNPFSVRWKIRVRKKCKQIWKI